MCLTNNNNRPCGISHNNILVPQSSKIVKGVSISACAYENIERVVIAMAARNVCCLRCDEHAESPRPSA